MNRPDYQSVGKSVRKKDSLQLLLGKPVFTEDIVPDALVVKLLRSPHANAIVEDIDTSKAKKIAGVVDVFTWEDVPGERFSNAGQTYPETSPYDRLIIDRHVRYVGDVVAIVAAESEKAAEAALSRIKVTYEVLDPVLDFRAAKDNPTLVHPEDDWHMLCDLGGDNRRNLVGTTADADGDVEAVLADCDIVLERTYHTKAFNQAMMETFRTYAELDRYGRLHVISSTQIVFHVRRILSHALGIPKSRIRVEKPRIGGGFGAKQTAVCEVYPAFVTLKTGRPAMCVFTRKEAQTCGSPRHEMEIKVRLGANDDGRIRALDVTTLSNSGAYCVVHSVKGVNRVERERVVEILVEEYQVHVLYHVEGVVSDRSGKHAVYFSRVVPACAPPWHIELQLVHFLEVHEPAVHLGFPPVVGRNYVVSSVACHNALADGVVEHTAVVGKVNKREVHAEFGGYLVVSLVNRVVQSFSRNLVGCEVRYFAGSD